MASPEEASPLLGTSLATRKRRQWTWRAFLVILVLALCLVAATSRIRVRAHIPQRHTHPTRADNSSLPVVLWHGMGDSCCASWSIGYIAQLISESLGALVCMRTWHDAAVAAATSPNAACLFQVEDNITIFCCSAGVYVHSIATGDGSVVDVSSSFFGNVNDQVISASDHRAVLSLCFIALFQIFHQTARLYASQVAKVCAEIAMDPDLQGGFNAVGFSQGNSLHLLAYLFCPKLSRLVHQQVRVASQGSCGLLDLLATLRRPVHAGGAGAVSG